MVLPKTSRINLTLRYGKLFRGSLTWHFSRRCESFVSLPVPQLPTPFYKAADWPGYELGVAFQEELLGAEVDGCRVLDLNIIANYLGAVVHRHLRLVQESGLQGPFYAKARVENSWRTIPFVDSQPYLDHLKELGIPIVQEGEMLVPPGATIDTFVRLDPLEEGDSLSEKLAFRRAIMLIVHVFESLGVPTDVVKLFAGELIMLGKRRGDYQRLLGDAQSAK